MRIKGQAGMGDTTVGVYYTSLDQDEEVDEAFFRQLIVSSELQALVTVDGWLSRPSSKCQGSQNP